MKKQYNNPPDGRTPLERRLRRLKQGLVSDEKVLDARLRQINDFPLDLWFGEHQERLEQLRRAFPELETVQTYGAAAARLWKHRMTRRGMEGMWLLLAPLLDIEQSMVKLSDGSGCYWGAR